MKLHATPPGRSTFEYRTPPLSGNVINGLGEREPRRARYVFHSTGRTGPLPWDRLQTLFRYTYPAWVLPQLLRNAWATFRPQGPVAAERVAGAPLELARRVKSQARALGADLVGICELRDEFLMEGADLRFRYAVSVGLAMDRDVMMRAPALEAGYEVLKVYERCSRLSVDLTRYIRALGWPARACPINSSSEVLHIPVAVAAGLGQLGKHGSLICREHGSNVRLTTVLTDMPLAADRPVDIGVDDLCSRCQVCVSECPPQAIFPEKQWVRGVEKWYVDFDRCVPYFADTYGCAICLEVCPWSEPGRGPGLAERLLATRARRAGQGPSGLVAPPHP